MRILLFVLLTVVGLSGEAFAASSTTDKFCGPGRHWVQAHFRRAYVRADGKHFKATTVRAHCSDNPPGYYFWSPKIKNDPPANWPNKSEVSKQWTAEEMEKILEALSYLPQEMSRDDILGIFRMARSIVFPNPASGDHIGDIVIYDTAFDQENNLAQILSHEIAHRIYDSLSQDDKRSYSYAAGWINFNPGGDPPDFVLLRQKMVDPDSANSVEEDFSNNMEFFLFNPLKLQEVSPETYKWISKRFGVNFKLGKGSPQ